MSRPRRERSFITAISQSCHFLMRKGHQDAAQLSHSWPTYGSQNSVKPTPSTPPLIHVHTVTTLTTRPFFHTISACIILMQRVKIFLK